MVQKKILVLLTKEILDYEFEINANNEFVRLVKAIEEVLIQLEETIVSKKK